jgi:hypothetical protein
VAVALLEGLGEQVGELKAHQLDLHVCAKRGEQEMKMKKKKIERHEHRGDS